jgi:hypothetical protein
MYGHPDSPQNFRAFAGESDHAARFQGGLSWKRHTIVDHSNLLIWNARFREARSNEFRYRDVTRRAPVLPARSYRLPYGKPYAPRNHQWSPTGEGRHRMRAGVMGVNHIDLTREPCQERERQLLHVKVPGSRLVKQRGPGARQKCCVS